VDEEVFETKNSWRKCDHPQFRDGEKYRVRIEPMYSISRTVRLSAQSRECGNGHR
jgi:hypothetical protein